MKSSASYVIRLLDIFLATAGLIAISPFVAFALLAIWLEDRSSPLYFAARVGRNGQMFNMIKLRTMVVNAEKIGANSTADDDRRITKIGSVLRRYKLDELVQLWNVLRGQMSLVGPRPNVAAGVRNYTSLEKGLLSVRPGITDMASVVFSDEGEILRGSKSPDEDYDVLIRPWKSKLALLYVDNMSVKLYLKLILITIRLLKTKKGALEGIQKLLEKLDVDEQLKVIASRKKPLQPTPLTILYC